MTDPTNNTQRVANKFSPKEFREELLQIQADQFDAFREEIRELRGQVDRLTTLVDIVQRKGSEYTAADEFMMSQLGDIHMALDSLIHTFDTPSQIEKRSILERAIRGVNSMNQRLGSPFPHIPLA